MQVFFAKQTRKEPWPSDDMGWYGPRHGERDIKVVAPLATTNPSPSPRYRHRAAPRQPPFALLHVPPSSLALGRPGLPHLHPTRNQAASPSSPSRRRHHPPSLPSVPRRRHLPLPLPLVMVALSFDARLPSSPHGGSWWPDLVLPDLVRAGFHGPCQAIPAS